MNHRRRNGTIGHGVVQCLQGVTCTVDIVLGLHSWSKVYGHLELECFHYRPLFDDESGSLSQTWPSPPYNVASGGTL